MKSSLKGKLKHRAGFGETGEAEGEEAFKPQEKRGAKILKSVRRKARVEKYIKSRGAY